MYQRTAKTSPFDDEGWDDNIENNDSIPGEDDVWPNDTIPGDDNVWPNDTIPGEDDILPNDSIVSSGEFHNGHALVDLGLSVKWATCNVGATKPEEYGGYYAWGETEEKNNYDWDTYKYGYYNEEGYSLCSKYCLHEYCGLVDNKTILDASDDVAHVKWGGNWRMPSYKEAQELNAECKWEEEILNGVNGMRVTGPNGNSIFLPAAGGYGGEDIGYVFAFCYCWTTSLADEYCDSAWGLQFVVGYNVGLKSWINGCSRSNGRSVRPVCD